MKLIISHYIYLNREQRYALHEGECFEVIGISIPVWQKENFEAKEIFCKYYLSNPKTNKGISILEKGYEIPLPYYITQKNILSEREWRKINLTKPQLLYNKNHNDITSEALLDIKDKGSECLCYREINHKVEHFVKISDFSILEDTSIILQKGGNLLTKDLFEP